MNTYAKVIFLYYRSGLTIRMIAEVLHNELNRYADFGSGYTPTEKTQKIIATEINQIEAIRQEEMKEKNLCETPMEKRAVKVVDTQTGQVFETILQAAIWNNINSTTLQKKLSGQRTNDTSIRYYQEGL